ncbi:MAG TPA: 3-phosphoserine/phosphohydroxythreonine transaminase [Treponemataceae bacterium]|nr:3-phosphoserine/phosphohydroxythreonine transaminase [Treponemataceae bacterium]
MARVLNFSAGPSCLPEEVLKQAEAEMLDCNGTGQSVNEMSHRSSAFTPIIQETEHLIRELMDIPAHYKVLFLQGGASTQFAMVPLNLGTKYNKAAYVDTGTWSAKAIKEAKRYIDVDVIASSADKGFSYIPENVAFNGDYDYAHITLNNTIKGTHWKYIPKTNEIPLVADISSCILSEPLDVSKFAVLYAGAQKNLAPAGVTIVIIREDLITETPLDKTPLMLTYKTHSDKDSMFNTPPCWNIYMMGLNLKWIKKQGGAKGMAKRNKEKATLLYNYLDKSDCYSATVAKGSRSLMNVPFLTSEKDEEKAKEISKQFVKAAEKEGLFNLSGHRSVGGMRASIYNAMTLEGVQKLVTFMECFAQENIH